MEEEVTQTEGGEVSTQSTQAQPAQHVEQAQSGFKVPEAYKDKGWYKNFEGKTEEDFFKAFDNAQSAMGKKYLPPDFDNASEEDIKRYYDTMRPKDVSEYEFPEGTTDEEKGFYSSLLHENGLTKHQAKGLVDKFMGHMNSMKEAAFSEDGMREVMTKKFGNSYEKAVGEVGALVKQHGSKEAQQVIDNQASNELLGAFYEVLNSMKEAYGANEGDAAAGGTTNKAVDYDAEMGKVRQQIADLSKNPYHKSEDKAKLIQQLSDLNTKKIGSKK